MVKCATELAAIRRAAKGKKTSAKRKKMGRALGRYQKCKHKRR